MSTRTHSRTKMKNTSVVLFQLTLLSLMLDVKSSLQSCITLERFPDAIECFFLTFLTNDA